MSIFLRTLAGGGGAFVVLPFGEDLYSFIYFVKFLHSSSSYFNIEKGEKRKLKSVEKILNIE